MEEDLDEIIEIKTENPYTLKEILKTSNVEIDTGEYKVILPRFEEIE